jgi:predicted amidohydrolase
MKIKTAVIQMRTQILEPELNLEKGYGMLEKALNEGAKLVVMPEMWVVGLYPDVLKSPYVLKTAEIIEEISRLAKKAAAFIVAGSHPHIDYYDSKTDKRIFNRVYLINQSGSVCGTYNKIQLFKKNNEHAYSKPGFKIFNIQTDNFIISPFVCFDLRFPELFRIAAFNGAEIISVSSQFPASRIGHWRSLLTARAIENQCFVVASNTCGFDGLLELGGNSMIISPAGEILSECGGEEGIIYHDIDMGELRAYREKFNFIDESVLKDDLKSYINKKLIN